jgi:hypothetical protein
MNIYGTPSFPLNYTLQTTDDKTKTSAMCEQSVGTCSIWRGVHEELSLSLDSSRGRHGAEPPGREPQLGHDPHEY